MNTLYGIDTFLITQKKLYENALSIVMLLKRTKTV